MDSNFRVTIITVSWNGIDTLERCLSGVARQTLQPTRVIVVDNASSDGSANMIREKFPWVELHAMELNLGFADANNLAIKEVGTEWTALLNPDAFPSPDWLENLAASALENHDYSFFASHMALHGKTGVIDGTGDVYHVSGLAWRRDHSCIDSQNPRSSGEIFSACAAAALYKTDALKDVEGFDSDFFCYLEDVDLGFRLRLLGHKCMYVSAAVVEHVGVTSTGKNKPFAVFHSHRNMVWVYIKNMPFPLIWVYFPQFLMANLATLVWQSLQGNCKMIFKAKWQAVSRLSQFMKKRDRIQKQKRVSVKEISRILSKKWWLPYLRNKKVSEG